MDGAQNVGATYYAQWKITDDDLVSDGDLLGGGSLRKYQVYGVGHELMLPIETKKKLYGLISACYLWEFDAKSTLEGNKFLFTFLFPIPSRSLQ